jgi:Leucine-rich repeat (LRR) protein
LIEISLTFIGAFTQISKQLRKINKEMFFKRKVSLSSLIYITINKNYSTNTYLLYNLGNFTYCRLANFLSEMEPVTVNGRSGPVPV